MESGMNTILMVQILKGNSREELDMGGECSNGAMDRSMMGSGTAGEKLGVACGPVLTVKAT